MQYNHKEIKVPSFDQLKSCIYNGDDSVKNQLILDAYGSFKLNNIYHQEFESNTAVKNEYFIENNGYVGPEASESQILHDYYVTMLVLFRNFLTNGELNNSSNEKHIQADKNQLIKEISDIIKNTKN